MAANPVPANGRLAVTEQPAPPAAPHTASWLQNAWKRVQAASDGERRVTLFETVQRGTASGRRVEAIQSYWELCGAVLLRSEAQEDLRLISRYEPQAGQQPNVFWTAVHNDLQAVVHDAELRVTRATLALSGGRYSSDSQVGVLPVDAPLAGAYRTNYQMMFPRGAAPANLQRLNATLPLELASLEARGQSVKAHEAAVNALIQALQRGQIGMSQLGDAVERLRRQRTRLVDALISYNRHTAEYAMSVGAAQTDATVVSMLIPKPTLPVNVATQTGGGGVVPATALAPLDAANAANLQAVAPPRSMQTLP